MSLKHFLAVGHSFVGIRPDKSPFAMRRQNQLPIFGVSPRFAANGEREAEAMEMIQGELIGAVERTEVKSAPVFSVAELERKNAPDPGQPRKIGERAEVIAPDTNVSSKRRKKGWLFYFTFGVLGRSRKESDLVQAELSLEQIRVIRNDLADSDLELVMKKKRVQKPSGKPVCPVRSPEAPPQTPSTWNELAARLFEIGQH